MQQKRRRGAPRKAVTASKLLNIRVTEAQHTRWTAAAHDAGKTLSAWLKSLADAQAGGPVEATYTAAAQPVPAPPTFQTAAPPAGESPLPFGAWPKVTLYTSLAWQPAVVDDRQTGWMLKEDEGAWRWERTAASQVRQRGKALTAAAFFVYFREELYRAHAHPAQLGS